jgi:ABC-type sulfate transport system substrate-binding protein
MTPLQEKACEVVEAVLAADTTYQADVIVLAALRDVQRETFQTLASAFRKVFTRAECELIVAEITNGIGRDARAAEEPGLRHDGVKEIAS